MRYMNMRKNIPLWFLCAALLILASCVKNETPAEEKTPVGFCVMSQGVLAKSGTTTSFPSTIERFGVWGIAGNSLNIQYLWNQSSLIDVVRDADGTYIPVVDGYWLSNSTHDFLALASDPSTVALPSVRISHTTDSGQLNPEMAFTYDLSERYAAKDYTYDLLGAAARRDVKKVIPTSQDLIFWHLFSKININVKFVDANGNDITDNGSTLYKVRFTGVHTSGEYTMLNAGTTANPLALSCSVSNQDNPTELILTSSLTLNILPQDISGFRLFLDFMIKLDGKDTYMTDFEIDLTPAKEKASPYTFNNQYNWNITIGPKNAISFKVEVAPWDEVDVNDPDTPIEII